MGDLDRIDGFLGSCLRGECPAWPEEWSDASATDLLCDRIDAHGIALVLAHRRGDLAAWPASVLAALLEQARQQAFWEEVHRRLLQTVFEKFAGEGVEALVMKGTALAYGVYPDPAMRRRGDSDLLVRASQLAAARRVLREMGMVLAQTPVGVVNQEVWSARSADGQKHNFDLHWRIADAPLLQNILDEDAFFAEAIPLPLLGATARAPGHVHGFVQGCLNQHWHEFWGYHRGPSETHSGKRLIWVLDNSLQAQRFTAQDWDALVQFCAVNGVAPVVLRALQMAKEVLRAPVPEEVLRHLSEARSDAQLMRYLSKVDNAFRFRANFSAAKGISGKAAYLWSNLFATPEHLRAKYPQSAGWPVFALQIRRLLGNFAGVLGLRSA